MNHVTTSLLGVLAVRRIPFGGSPHNNQGPRPLIPSREFRSVGQDAHLDQSTYCVPFPSGIPSPQQRFPTRHIRYNLDTSFFTFLVTLGGRT